MLIATVGPAWLAGGGRRFPDGQQLVEERQGGSRPVSSDRDPSRQLAGASVEPEARTKAEVDKNPCPGPEPDDRA
jgi:hypothetical protein